MVFSVLKIFVTICIIIISLIAYKIYIRIESKKYKIIYRMAIFVIMLFTAFFVSIKGISSHIFFLFLIELLVGFIICIYCLIFSIKNKSINYMIFTPFFLIIFCIAGIYYGERHYRKILTVANNITVLYFENNDIKDKNELLGNVIIPKKMKIEILNEETIIFYNDLVYNVDRGRLYEKRDDIPK